MSSRETPVAPPRQPVRRVRHEVRDGLAVVCASLAASTALVFALALITKLAG